MDATSLSALLLAAAAAGWVDAVVGGGGLLLLPALLVAMPGLPMATVLGTNKAAAIAGTTTAALTYARRTDIDWSVAAPTAVLAVVASGIGAATASSLPTHVFRPIVLGVLVSVALFVTLRPTLGLVPHPHRRTRARIIATVALAGGLIAAYDGMVGPGTGTFLVLTFTTVLGTDFLHGSAMARLINAGTNLGALLVFGWFGHVHWWLGAALAACNIVGAILGARTALRHGSGFVRVVLLVVVFVLIAKLAYDQWFS